MKHLALIALLAASPAQAGSLPPDKVGHFVVGGAIGFVTATSTQSFELGCGAAVLAGIAKEIYDGPAGGHQEIADALFTAAGGCLGALTLRATIDRSQGATGLVYDQHPMYVPEGLKF